MLQSDDYIRMSLELDLFFLRVMKEHSLFLKAAFPAKNLSLSETAGYFMRQFDGLLQEATELAGGVLIADALNSGQFYTPFTLDAERATQYYTGILINSSITSNEQALQPGSPSGGMPDLADRVSELNQRAMAGVTSLAAFKGRLLSDILGCKLFMSIYPLIIDHMLREAVLYNSLLMKLQNRYIVPQEKALADKEAIWNILIAEHAKVERGMLDPSESDLFNAADSLGKEFDGLAQASKRAQANPALLPDVTAESLSAMQRVRDFATAGTSNILNCKVKSVILPLLSDHILRETNHYIYVLKSPLR